MIKKLVVLILLVLVLFPFFKTVCQQKESYLAPFDAKNYQSAYEISQYVLTEKASWIPDEVVYVYAAWNYLNGGNPVLVNPENPPLGKYLIALSIKLFNKEKLPGLVFGFLSLLTFFFLCRLVLGSTWLALVPVLIFSWQRIYQEQLIYVPLFETFALTFLVLTIFFFLKTEKRPGFFWLSGFFLGCLWATKPWMLTPPLLAAELVFLLWQKRYSQLFYWLVSLSAAVLMVLLSYFRLFIEGWSFYRVLSVQKWIAWYHRSKLIKWGTVWPYLYLKRWYVWWGDQPFVSIDQWNLSWPVFTSLALVLSILIFLKVLKPKKDFLSWLGFSPAALLLCLWVVFYLLFLSFGNVTTRYVFYLLPFTYLLGVYFLVLLGRGKMKLWE